MRTGYSCNLVSGWLSSIFNYCGCVNASMEKSKFYSEVKIVRLKNHPRHFSSEDMIINFDWFSREKFQLIPGTVIEIFPIEEKKSKDRKNHLLLEVKTLSHDLQAKGGPISISQEVAIPFNLISGKDICVRRVDKELVALDLVEFRFKDQVLSRSDMWRFTNSLIGKGMYVPRKIEFAGMLLKVSELWAQGEKVKSGAVVDSSRVVFRSASSQMFIFLQVSCEVWEFDPNGDMYQDKAVDGFMRDLFQKWKDKQCNHEVTVVLFARKYYKSPDLASSEAVLMRDKRGHYYEDYYKLIMEKETRSDWLPAIVEIKRGLKEFQTVLKPGNPHRLICDDDEYNDHNDEWVSTSPETNLLEAMNLAINVLECHFKEVSFNTTGQQIIIVSPGTGVFEVDQQMNLLTRERIIDNGIGADLVCLNEQPLHSVPLFKFHQSDANEEERYHIPHWINYSFYNPPRPWDRNRFKPRIVMSDHLINKYFKAKVLPKSSLKPLLRIKSIISLDPNDPLSRPTNDYDEYDAKIFSSGKTKQSYKSHTPLRKAHSMTDEVEQGGDSPSTIDSPDVFSDLYDTRSAPNVQESGGEKKQMFYIQSPPQSHLSSSYHAQTIVHDHQPRPRVRYLSDNYDEPITSEGMVYKSGSAENIRNKNKSYQLKKKKALINPFDPKKTYIEEISSHNCRWTHTFPRDKEGKPFQRHHNKPALKSVQENVVLRDFEESVTSSGTVTTAISSPMTSLSSDMLGGVSSLDNMKSLSSHSLSSMHTISPSNNRKIVQNFSAVKREGMDWTSFVEPACLPLTTDFYPDNSTLARDYTDYPTNLTVNAYGEVYESEVSLGWRSNHLNMSTIQAFKEMISQRLLQGFQLVFDKESSLFTLHRDLQELQEIVSGKKKKKNEMEIVVKFSLGRVFQRIDLSQLTMIAHTFRSKNPLGVDPFHYQYHLVTNDSAILSMRSILKQIGMNGYNWNYLDQHVCGHEDFDNYQESNRFWRCRYLLLPMTPPSYDKCAEERDRWLGEIVNEFIKFTEFVNHIKRTPPTSSKIEFNRLHSLPVSSRPYSRSPSPTPTPKRHSDNEAYRYSSGNSPHTPLRTVTDPTSVGVAYKGHRKKSIDRTYSRDDISSVSYKERESPRTSISKTPQPYLSLQIRHKDEVISDLKQLALTPCPKPVSHGSQYRVGHSPLQQPFLNEEDEDRSYTKPLQIIPNDKRGFESSLDYSTVDVDDESGELTMNTSLYTIVNTLFNKNCGVDTFKLEKHLLFCCFGFEAVNWVLENIENITRKEAIGLMKRAVSENFLLHISGNRRIPFIDGSYMYCRSFGDSGIIEEWDMYKKKWFEVSIIHLVDMILPTMTYSNDGGNFSNASSRASSYISNLNSSPYYMHHREKSGSTFTDIFNRYVELNPDLYKKSDRPEWCYLHYGNSYHPLQAYEIEFQWMASTISLLFEMIQGLVHKASMCGFGLIPVLPVNFFRPTANHTQDGASINPSNPFCHPLTIHLNVNRDVMQESDLTLTQYIMIRFELIIQRFGFLLDPSCTNDIDLSEVSSMLSGSGNTSTTPTRHVYIHYTGSALIQPWYDSSNDTSGFYWYKNCYYLNQKITQPTAISKYNKLFEEFGQFCGSGESDKLVNNNIEPPLRVY